MDPHDQARLEHDGMILRLRNRAMLLRGIVAGASLPQRVETEDVTVVNQTKTSPIADYLRQHPKTPFVVRLCFAVLALALGGFAACKFVQKYFRR